MGVVPTVLAFLLGVAFMAAGGTKLVGLEPHPEEFARYDLPGMTPRSARLGVGAVEVLAAIVLVLAGLSGSAALGYLGGLLVIGTMAGALATHLRLGDPRARIVPAAVLLGLAVALLITA